MFSLSAKSCVDLNVRCLIFVFMSMLSTMCFFSVYDSYDKVSTIDYPVYNISCPKNEVVRMPCTFMYKNWFVSGFHINQSDRIVSQGYLEYKKTVVNNPEYLRLSGYLSTDKVVQGGDQWALVRLLLIFYDQAGTRLDVRHEVCQMIGTHPFELCEQTFEVPYSAVDVAVQVVNAAATGTVAIKQLRLEVMEESPVNFYIQSGFLFAWLILAVVCMGWLRLWEQRFDWLVLLLATLIVVGVLSPDGVINRVASELRSVLADVSELLPHHSDEIVSPNNERHGQAGIDHPANVLGFSDWVGFLKSGGHMGLFISLSFFACLMAFSRNQRHPVHKFLSLLIYLLLFAACTETLQMVTLSRTGSWHDFGLDAVGVLVGLVVSILCKNVFRSEKSF